MSSPGTPETESVTVTAVKPTAISAGPAGAVKIFDPQIKVTLRKSIGRKETAEGAPASKRFQDSSREVALWPYVGEHGSVTVSKGVRDPMGSFSIVLADAIMASQQDTIYAAIEPMDVIEISMVRDGSKYAGKDLPIMMRGIVTTIERVETMTATGPQRSVVVTGHDYGKLLQIMQIAYLPNEVTGQKLLTYFKYFQNYNPEADATKPANEFVKGVLDNVINSFIGDIQGKSGEGASPFMAIKADLSVTEGVVAPFGTIQSFEGTVWDQLRIYGDVGPWNELFVEDRDDGVYLVYRPNPFKRADGSSIQGSPPATVSVTDREIISMRVARTDAGVYNYYWVEPVNFTLNTPGFAAIQAAHGDDVSSFFLTAYQNSDPKLYGFRRLQVSTQQGARFDGKADEDYRKYQMGPGFDFASDRRKVIVDSNKDNVVFERGSIEMMGHESLKAGRTLQVTRGSADPAEFYMTGVQHVYRPFGNYIVSAEVERGTGFIERSKSAKGTYLAEMNVGGVYAE